MRRRIYITLLLLAAVMFKAGAVDGFRTVYGIEYGYTSTVSEWHHTNYVSPEGPRVNQIHMDYDYVPLGYASLWYGAEFARHWSTCLVLSLNGISKERTISVLSMRIAYFFKSYEVDGVKLFMDAGAGVTETFKGLPDFCGKAGGAYRLVLADKVSLDLCASVQLSVDHPVTVRDRFSGNILTLNSIRRSDALYTGINIGLMLGF